MERTFATPEPIDLLVQVHAGEVVVLAEERTTTEVRVSGRRSEVFVVEQTGRRIAVQPPPQWRGVGTHQVHIAVPSGSDVGVRTGAARVVLDSPGGRFGEVSVKTGSGGIRIERARTVALSTGSGRIECGAVEEELRAKSGSGDIGVARLAGPATVSTGSGDVRVDEVAAGIAVKTGSGDLTVGRLDGAVRYGTASGVLTVKHAVRGRVDAKSASGGVRLGVASGTPVWTEIATAFGKVESHLPHVGEPAPGQDHLRVRIQSASGKVVLVPIDPDPRDPAWPRDAPAPQDAPA